MCNALCPIVVLHTYLRTRNDWLCNKLSYANLNFESRTSATPSLEYRLVDVLRQLRVPTLPGCRDASSAVCASEVMERPSGGLEQGTDAARDRQYEATR